MSKIERKKAEAELKLAKQDAEEQGDDYERKRAWDWTIEESLKWDERTRQKAQNKDKAGFAGNDPSPNTRRSLLDYRGFSGGVGLGVFGSLDVC